jgi:hypothetical protein
MMSRVKAIGVIEHMVSTMDYIISSMAGTSFPEVPYGCVVIWESNCESQASKQARARLKFCHQKEKGGIETKTVPYASIEIRQGKI